MNNITIDTIRTYVNKLEQKGYSSEEITRKLHTALELMSWAYQNDHLKYSQFQQVKDEIANFKARFEASDLQEAQLAFKDSENLKSTKTPSFFDKITQRIPFYGSKKSENEENKKSTPQTNAGFQLNPQHYVGLAFVLLIMAILGAGIYERFFKSTGGIFAYPSTPSAASRILSFQGRLTDSLGNPITAATNMRFRLYTASSGGTTLYDTGTCSITPDQDGVHNVLIGSSCGSEVSSSVFTENTQVWLGVLVGSDAEMTPRQRMANVPYAMNAETLQGLPVGTEVSNIPYINAGGDLLMAAASPQIGSTYTNQDFLISSARALTIQSAGAGDVTLTATESGTIKFATGGSQHGVITNTGLFGFGSTGPDAKLDVLYTGGEQLRLTYADGSTYSSFTTNSGGDLTIDPSGDDLTIGGDLILADTFTVQVGGKTATAYNAFANSGDAPEDGSISSDNDVYIGGDLEVDGNIVGTVSPGFTQGSVVFTDGSGNLAQDNASFFFDDTNNLLGIGTASPVGKLHVTGAATGKALSIFNETGDQNIITASASGTTVANLDRSGNLAIEGAISDLGGTTLAVNDNLDVSGTLFSGTADAFQVDASGNITAVGGTFSGDIAVNGGDLTSSASTFNLSIANAGTINFRDGSNTLVAIKDQGVYPFLNLAGKTDTGDPGTCAEGDIYYNDTDDSIKVCHESNSWEALDGGAVASQWTDGGTTVYLTDTTDELVIGGSSPLSSAKFSIDGDADQIQLIVQGNATQTTNLATFEQSDGTDVFTITNAGNLTSAGDLAVNGDDITSDSNLTLNATGYTRIGDTASPGSANGDDDLFVEGDLEIDGVLYTDGGIDTAFTAGSVVFAGASGVLAQDNASFFWDDTNNKLGLGDTTPDAKLEISGAVVGKALTILNETGDQDIIAASASGVTRFRVGNDGTVYGGYFADISNSAYGIDPAGTSNFGGYSLKVTGGALLAVDTGNVGIGDSTPDAKLNILATTEQLRLDYDDSNYTSFTVSSSGDLTIAPTGGDTNITGNSALTGDLAVNGDDITADGALTINSASYTRIGDTASPGSATGDDDLYVESDIELDGVLYLDGTIDTTFTAGSVVFAGTSGVLAEDNTNFFFNDSTNKLGLGDTTPDAFLDLTGTTEQLRLSYETGDTNYASFTLSSAGDLTIAPTGGDLALTGDVDISDQFAAGPNGAITANTIGHIAYSTVPVDTNGTYGIQLTQTTTGSGSSSQGHTGIYNYLADNSTSTGNLSMTAIQSDLYMQNGSVGGNSTWRNVYGFLKNEATGGTHNGSLYNFYASALNAGTKIWSSEFNYYSLLTNSGAVTTSNFYNFYAASPVNASGTLTTAYGMRVEDQSVGTNTNAYGVYVAAQAGGSGDNVGLYIADADDYSIQLASTDGDAASGITFGTDTNVYRSAANTLKTDDNLIVGLDLRIADTGTLEIGGLTGVAYNAISDSGTTSHSLASDDDLFVEGDLEVDGVLYADGGITATGTVSATDFSCTDCLDFAEFEDTLDLDTTLILNQGTNTWTQNFTGTTTVGYTFAADSVTSGTGIELSADALAGGKGLYVSSTSTALTTGNLALVDWSPGSTTNATGDLFKINIGTNGNVGNILNVTDTSSSLFRVAENQIESAIPHSFTAAGDVSIAYDLLFSNQTASFIKSSGPFTIEAGETFESNDFTLKTYNSGNVLLDAGGSTTNTGTISFYDSNIKGATVTTAIPFANASADINTFRTNFTDETIIDALNEVYAAASSGGVWTDSATTAYLTTTTDDVVIGGSSPLSSAKLSIDGDADQTQLIVQGNATQTTDLVIFETSAGTDLFNVTNAGNVDAAGTLTSGTANAFVVDASGNISTSGTTGLTFSSTGGIVLAGGTLSDGTDGVDIADNLEVTGDTTLAGDLAVNGDDISSDADLTITPAGGDINVAANILPSTDDTYDLGSNTKRWKDLYLGGETVHLGTSTTDEATFSYTTSTNKLTIQNNYGAGLYTSSSDGFDFLLGGGAGDDFTVQGTTFVVETDNNRVGIGTAAPDAKLHVTGTSTGKALTIFNETGDQNVLVASVAGALAFSVTNAGDISRGNTHGVIGLNDQASLAPNASFEIYSNSGQILPDSWVAKTGAVTKTTDARHGDNAILLASAGDIAMSTCFPIAGNNARGYTMSLWSKSGGVSINTILRAGLYTYTTKANCISDTPAGTNAAVGQSPVATTYTAYSGTSTPGTGTYWARAYVWNNNGGGDNTDIYADGLLVWPANNTSGLDLAETYPVDASEKPLMGEIVRFGNSTIQEGADVKNITRSKDAYDNQAFGIVASQPGFVLDDNGTYNKVQVALKGRVPVLVTTENGPIKVGDPITASSKPGIGMKATRSGRIIGYAMSEWISSDPHEVDQVLVFMNPETYVDLSILTQLQESVAKFPSMTASVLTQADSIIINTAEAALLKTESLIATTIKATNATIDNLIVDRIVSREITSVSVKTETLQAQNIEAKDATFSGKLVAQEIDADNIRELRDRLERLSAQQNSEPAFDSAGLQEEVENIQDYLENLPEQETSPSLPINEIATNTSIDPGTITSITGEQISMMDLENLTVTGTAAMTSLAVADSFTAGNIFVKDNSVLSLSNELKLSALEQVNIMDGAVIIAKNGTITAKGEVIAEKGVRTNTIKPLDANSAVGLQLSQNKVEVLNNNNVVAAINNDGSAKFKDVSVDTYTEATGSAVIIAAEDNYDENGILSPGIQTNAAAAGNGIIPAKNDTIVIFNDTISAKSLVYVTASSKTYNQNLYVAEKKSCTAEEKLEENCKPYFTVHIDGVVKDAITFNWWIVN